MLKKRKFTEWNQLVALGVDVTIDSEGKIVVTQDGKVKPAFVVTTHHKYGKDAKYVAHGIFVNSSRVGNLKYGSYTILEHVLVYLKVNGSLPDNMDIDHIDNDSLNNNPDNLQLLSRTDNLRKKTHQRNQFTCNLTEKELQAKNQAKLDKIEWVKMHKDYYYAKKRHKIESVEFRRISRALEKAKMTSNIAEYNKQLELFNAKSKEIESYMSVIRNWNNLK